LDIDHLTTIRVIGNKSFKALDFRLGFLGVRTPFCKKEEKMSLARIYGNRCRAFLKNHA